MRPSLPLSSYSEKRYFVGAHRTGNNGDATRAEGLFSTVINDYGFELLEDYADLWVIGNEQHSEIIWTGSEQ